MGVMSTDEARAFLTTGTRTGKLATASPTGSPHVAPVWFVLDGDELVFTTGRATVKGRHLLANPRAGLTVDESVYPYSFVVVRGPVTVDTEDTDAGRVAWATRIAARYVPAGQADGYGRRNGVPEEMVCRLRLERVVGARDIAG